MRKTLSLLSLLLLTVGCEQQAKKPTAYSLYGARGSLTPTEFYVVKPGDTLFNIAWRYGLDIDELARLNDITNINRILAGSRLRLLANGSTALHKNIPPPPDITAQGQSDWIWPTKGQVIREFVANRPGYQGIKISGRRGQEINAAHDGEVAYVGAGITGFGRMVILRHNDSIFSAYGYLDSVDVQEGQQVTKGQKIAAMGISPQEVPALHFEIRQYGPSVNPYSFIGTTPRYR